MAIAFPWIRETAGSVVSVFDGRFTSTTRSSQISSPRRHRALREDGQRAARARCQIKCPTDLTTQSDYKAELAVVIGRQASQIQPHESFDHIFAFTVANDVSPRGAQFADGQWTRGKSFDTLLPIGPFLTLADSGPDVTNLRTQCRLNGVTMHDDNTGSMLLGIPYLVSYVSRFITLVPGDVILTGTPAALGFAREPSVFLDNGDVLEVVIESLGVLSNPMSTAPVGAVSDSMSIAVEEPT